LYAQLSSLHVCVLPDLVGELLRFGARISSMLLGVSFAAAPNAEDVSAMAPLAGKMCVSLQDLSLAVPGVRVPTSESVGVVLELSAEASLEATKDAAHLDLQVQRLAARRSAVTRVRHFFSNHWNNPLRCSPPRRSCVPSRCVCRLTAQDSWETSRDTQTLER
jgi:hypothetical protein